jgi:hypothetical protein
MCFSYVFDELCCFYVAAMLLVLLLFHVQVNKSHQMNTRWCYRYSVAYDPEQGILCLFNNIANSTDCMVSMIEDSELEKS